MSLQQAPSSTVRRLEAVSRQIDAAGCASTEASPAHLMSKVVKIFTQSVSPSYSRPWQKNPERSSTGSGFAIVVGDKEKLILTNSHVIHNATSIRVRRHGRPGKFLARLVCEGRQCDLALLAVEDPLFWDDLATVDFSEELPEIGNTVTAIGYPMGGDNISVTRGVISRIDMMDYTFTGSGGGQLLVIQVDAAINPGNSGGPVFVSSNNSVVGVAFAGINGSSNIGYVIPRSVVALFLDSYLTTGSNTFGGLCHLGVTLQKTENSSLRAVSKLGQIKGKDGLLVVKVEPLSAVADKLKKGDVVLSIDGEPVAEDGTVAFRGEDRLPFHHLITSKRLGSTVKMQVLSDGSLREIDAVLSAADPLCPRLHGVDAVPSYYIIGGLLFQPLSIPWLSERFGAGGRRPPELLVHMNTPKEFRDEQVVVLGKVLATDANFGYADGEGLQLKSVNDVEVRNMAALVHRVAEVRRNSDDPYIRFEMVNEMTLVLEKAALEDAEARVLEAHFIPNPASTDLLHILK